VKLFKISGGKMRITGGYYKGRKIYCPKSTIRPAMDRMRESLFAILGDLSGCSFLDLFSGSGVVGIEAASRGAEPVILVEKDKQKINVLKRNISFLHTEIRIIIAPVEHFIKRYKDQFDYIFIDPPFNFRYKKDILRDVVSHHLFSNSGFIIIHLPKEEESLLALPELRLIDKRIYGRSLLLFFKQAQEQSQIQVWQ
jgi:16S rRNA (guanine966-N2)-methyltransferase